MEHTNEQISDEYRITKTPCGYNYILLKQSGDFALSLVYIYDTSIFPVLKKERQIDENVCLKLWNKGIRRDWLLSGVIYYGWWQLIQAA